MFLYNISSNCGASQKYTKLTDLAFEVPLQLKDLVSNAMKVPQKTRNSWQRWVCSTSFFKKKNTVTS